MTISRTPATLAGTRVHHDRRRIGRLAAGHVDPDAVERRHALAELRAVGVDVAPGVRPLPLVIARMRSAAAPSASRTAGIQAARARVAARAAESPARATRGRVEAVESPRVFEQRRVAARSHVGDDRGDRAVDRLVLRRFERDQLGEPGVEIGLAGGEPPRSQSWAETAAAKASSSGWTRSRFSLSAAWLTMRRARDRHDLLDRDELVRAQRVAGARRGRRSRRRAR